MGDQSRDPCRDPCAPDLPPQVIQLTIGDDWGLAFLYVDKTNMPIAVQPDVIVGQLYAPFQSNPLLLDQLSGRSIVVDDPQVSFALGLESAITSTLQADGTPPASHLQIQRESNGSGLLRTIGHFALQIIKGNVTPGMISQPVYVDPLSGDKVVLVGYTTLVPTGG